MDRRSVFAVVCGLGLVGGLAIGAKRANSGLADAVVRLQQSSPGIQQLGNSNISGAGIFGGQVSGRGAASGTAPGVYGETNSTVGSAMAVEGIVLPTNPGGSSAAVRGMNNGTGASGIGVWGSQNGSGWGVYGSSTSGIGGNFVGGTVGGGTGTAVNATGGNIGVNATGTSRGIDATATSTTAQVFAVEGSVNTSAAQAAGVHGTNATTTNVAYGVLGEILPTTSGVSSAAVRGDNHGTGTSGIGVWGSQDGAGVGVLGQVFSGTGVGVQGIAPASGTAVLAQGDLNVTGTKSFVDPHPTDPTKQISYVCLEGPEVGVYCRGRGHFSNGVAVIQVPDIFRMEAEPNDLSIQITPIGRKFTSVTVESLNLEQVVVLGSEDVDFFYMINGIRKGYADYDPIKDNTVYVPQGPDQNIWNSLNEEQKIRLVANGIYSSDGTLNRATLHRLGWDARWGNTALSRKH